MMHGALGKMINEFDTKRGGTFNHEHRRIGPWSKAMASFCSLWLLVHRLWGLLDMHGVDIYLLKVSPQRVVCAWTDHMVFSLPPKFCRIPGCKCAAADRISSCGEQWVIQLWLGHPWCL